MSKQRQYKKLQKIWIELKDLKATQQKTCRQQLETAILLKQITEATQLQQKEITQLKIKVISLSRTHRKEF